MVSRKIKKLYTSDENNNVRKRVFKEYKNGFGRIVSQQEKHNTSKVRETHGVHESVYEIKIFKILFADEPQKGYDSTCKHKF